MIKTHVKVLSSIAIVLVTIIAIWQYNYLHSMWGKIHPIDKFNIIEIGSWVVFIIALIFMAWAVASPTYTYKYLSIKYIVWGFCDIFALLFSLSTYSYITLIDFMYYKIRLPYIHNEMMLYVYKYLKKYIKHHGSIFIQGKKIRYITIHSKYIKWYLENNQQTIFSKVLNYASNRNLEISGIFKALNYGLLMAIICCIIFISIYLFLDRKQCNNCNITLLLTKEIIALIPLYLAEFGLIGFLLKDVYEITNIFIVSSAAFIAAISINLISNLDENNKKYLDQKRNLAELNCMLLKTQWNQNYMYQQGLAYNHNVVIHRLKRKHQHAKERHLWIRVIAKLLTNDKP